MPKQECGICGEEFDKEELVGGICEDCCAEGFDDEEDENEEDENEEDT